MKTLLGFLVIASLFGSAAWADETLIEWRFDTPNEMHGWVANHHWSDARIADGYWSAEIIDDDPILLSPVLDPPLLPTDRDYVEIRLRCSKDGEIQFFYTQTLEGKYGGFFRDRSIRKTIRASEEFRTIRLFPLWARYKKILRLRLDAPPNGGRFDLQYIAVKRLAAEPPPETSFDLRDARTAERFLKATLDSDVTATPNGLRVVGRGTPPVATIDAVRIPADENQWLIVRMGANSGLYGGFFFTSTAQRGWRYTFPICPDGRMHTYNVYLGDYYLVKGPQPRRFKRSRFRGIIRGFSIIPTYEPNGEGVIESVSFRPKPEGLPLLIVEYCGGAEGLYRVGRAAPVAVRVRNAGGSPARKLSVEFHANEGLEIEQSSVRGVPDSIPPDETATIFADVMPRKAGWREFTMKVNCRGGEGAVVKGRLRVEPPLTDLPQGEIPTPQPLHTPYDIGVYYFPGWWHLELWQTIPPYIERRPLLGYYDESSPIVADWDIKWAVEHGIDYFVVEWWWNKGKLWGADFLEKALLKSRFLPYIKFCVMWNNPEHFEPWTEQDFVNLTNYWIEHYFPNPSYKRHEDGRPIAFVLRANNFLDDFGAEGMARLMKDANERARKAGFKGIYWVACTPRGDPEPYIKAGFEAATLYNFAGVGSGGFPTSPAWQHIAQARTVWDDLPRQLTPFIPISTGFDHRPWFGRTPGNCRYGFTPDLFERHLRDARKYLDERGERHLIIEAWNEWGEGSCLAPTAQFGFELLRAIPRVFAPGEPLRPAVGPADVGGYPPEIGEIGGLWTRVFRPPLKKPRKALPAPIVKE